jgi:adenylate kinase family enzyme
MKVAVFGKPGGGKSTLAQQIATTGLPDTEGPSG